MLKFPNSVNGALLVTLTIGSREHAQRDSSRLAAHQSGLAGVASDVRRS
jgi:predicted regulator of Ras-like GTPase activity (Roadblock/LC7/MglB family)